MTGQEHAAKAITFAEIGDAGMLAKAQVHATLALAAATLARHQVDFETLHYDVKRG